MLFFCVSAIYIFFSEFFIRPDLIAYEELIPSEHIQNLNNAFNAAEKMGIPKMLDAEGKNFKIFSNKRKKG